MTTDIRRQSGDSDSFRTHAFTRAIRIQNLGRTRDLLLARLLSGPANLKTN